MTTDQNKQTRLHLRLDKEMRQRLEDAAQQSERCLTHEIIYRLKRTLERGPIEDTA